MALERLDPIANISHILTQASSGTVISRERLDLRNVGDPDDRQFMQTVVDTMLEMEPGNPDLLVRMNTDHNIYLIWVQGMRQPVNNGHFKLLYDMRHPVPGHAAVGNVQVFPAKGMQPMKLCVEVNPYGPVRQARERLDRENTRRSSHRTLPRADPRYSAPRRVRSRSRSPIRRSYSPPPRRISPTPARRHISSRSPSPSSDSSLSESPERSKSVLSSLLSFGGGGSKKPSRRSSSRRRK